MDAKRKAFLAACSGMLVFGIAIVTLGSVAKPLSEKFGMDSYTAGTLFSILPFGLIIGSLIVGPVCDRYGYRLMMSLAAAGICMGFEGIAYATDINLLRLFILVFGISAGFINGATNSIVVDVSDEHKGPNLSILGIAFGVGALGMPLVLSALVGRVSPLTVLSVVGWITLAVAIVYLFLPFPPAKQVQGVFIIPWKQLFSPLLLIISFYLFFQSSLESIITNWTTTYIASKGTLSEAKALLGLSIHMLGMIAMRLLTASVLRQMAQTTVLWICLLQLVAGLLLLHFGSSALMVYAGLFLAGAGLSGGFPVMLGFTGQYFAGISATAISFVFVIALTGNTLINYVTGILIQQYGIAQLPPVAYAMVAAMILLFIGVSAQLSKHRR
jgi:fucose permease